MSMVVIVEGKRIPVPAGVQAKGAEAMEDYLVNEAKKLKVTYPPEKPEEATGSPPAEKPKAKSKKTAEQKDGD